MQELGEVLFGLSYLPTAQRLSVSVIKAQNLKYANVVDDLSDFCEYCVRKVVGGRGKRGEGGSAPSLFSLVI